MAFTYKPQVDNNYFGRAELIIANRDLDLSKEVVREILKTVLPTHFQNRRDITYLQNYYKGRQDILDKTKIVRSEINHKVVENNAFHLVEFKKGFVFGEPIQYVQRLDADVKELGRFNDYMLENNKHSKDKDIAEDMYVGGVGYRIVLPKANHSAPFILENLDVKNTGIVYNNNIEKERLVAFTMFELGEEMWEIMAYTKHNVFYYTYNGKPSLTTYSDNVTLEYIREEPNPLRTIPIFEYKLNKNRLGIVELVLSTLNALNFISSADLDDIDQFIQSLLVFVNQEVDVEQLTRLLELGAIQINSISKDKPADVKLLVNKMLHSETKILYDRIYYNMLTIAGVPKMADKTSGGDTGQARMLGEGWTMAEARAIQDELSFKLSEKQVIDLALEICRNKASSKIEKLHTTNIEIKFTRNRSDNLLVKTQSLMNLKQAQVAPEVAFGVTGLFSDAQEAVSLSQRFFGQEFWQIDKNEPYGKPKVDDVSNAEPSNDKLVE